MTDPRAAWRVVERFEEAIAEYAGAPHAVAVDSCTNALYLCLVLHLKLDEDFMLSPEMPMPSDKWLSERAVVRLPKRTYVGVARAALNARCRVEFGDLGWVGEYAIQPTRIVDAARWLRRGMYRPGTWTCLSFHFTKHLPIGRGGAILCGNAEDAEWFRRARYDGRDQARPIIEQAEFQWGIHCYMEPEKAARGLLLMSALSDHNDPLPGEYPDLSLVKLT